MLRSTQIRQLALQLLFLFDAHGAIDEAMASQAAAGGSDDLDGRRRAIDAAKGAWENRIVSDVWVERLAPQWLVPGLAPLTSTFDRAGYLAAVRRAIEYVHAGDCFQASDIAAHQ